MPAFLQKRDLRFFLFLLFLTACIRIPSLHQPFENDSSAIAYHARLITEGEPLYGSHHTGHHLPGAYYVYAFAFSLLGDEVSSVKWVLLVWTAITVFFIYKVGTLLMSDWAGVLAGVLATVLYGHLLIAGTNSRIESFIGLPQILSVYCLLLYRQCPSPKRPWLLLGVGLFGGLALVFKPNYIAPFVLASIFLLLRLREEGFMPVIRQGLWITAGVLLAVVPVVGYFALQGLWSRFLLLFTIGSGYITVQATDDLSSPLFILLYPLLILGRSSAIALVGALSTIVLTVMGYVKQRETTPMGYIMVWFGLTFLTTGVSRVYLHNYYLVFLPAFSLLFAHFLYTVYEKMRIERISTARGFVVVGTILVLLASLEMNATYYYEYGRYALGRQSYMLFLQRGLPAGVGDTSLILQEIADYITTHTDEDDTIYYWSNLMELYYVADRHSSVDIIWPIYIDATGSYERAFTATYFLVDTQGGALGYGSLPAWAEDLLSERYTLETTLYGQQIYRLIE